MRALSLICKPLLPRILFIAFIILCTPAAVSAQQLSSRHWQRVEEARLMIEEVESRPAEQILEAFNRAPAPEANLQIYEAVALTYRDLVRRKDITEPGAKILLYNQIRMNVAYLQFGGDAESGKSKKLDLWIRQTLLRYLPREVLENEKVFYALDWLK